MYERHTFVLCIIKAHWNLNSIRNCIDELNRGPIFTNYTIKWSYWLLYNIFWCHWSLISHKHPPLIEVWVGINWTWINVFFYRKDVAESTITWLKLLSMIEIFVLFDWPIDFYQRIVIRNCILFDLFVFVNFHRWNPWNQVMSKEVFIFCSSNIFYLKLDVINLCVSNDKMHHLKVKDIENCIMYSLFYYYINFWKLTFLKCF